MAEDLTGRQRAKLAYEAERLLCKNDLYYLAKEVLGYKDMSPGYHRILADTIRTYKDEWQLHLHPRGHFKSTLLTVSETIQAIINNPNETILIVNAVLGNSVSFLREIKSHFLGNERFRYLFPEFVPNKASEEGTTDAFTTPARIDKWIREATVEIAGIDKSVVSRHYSRIIFDDVINNINVSTKEQREKVINSYKEYLSLLNPGGVIRVIGTRWHYYDLYGYLAEEIKAERRANLEPLFKMFVTKAWTDQDQTIPAFPERFNRKYLDTLKAKQGSYIFSCQYMNDPQPEEDKVFSRNDIRLAKEPIRAQEHELFYFCATDPSVSESDSSDPSVILTVAVNSNKQIFIVDIKREWINPDTFIDRVLLTNDKYAPLSFGVEVTAFQKTLKFFLEKEAQRRRQHINIVEMKRSSRISKVERIKRIQPFLKAGQIFLCTTDPMPEEHRAFLEELDSFPYGRYDDILDALTDVIEIQKSPSAKPRLRYTYRRSVDGSPYGTGYRCIPVAIQPDERTPRTNHLTGEGRKRV